MSTTMTVEIRGLRLRAFHGLYPQERTVGNMFEVSASLTYPVAGGCEDMEITDTISYADMAEIIRDEMSRPRDLLESVALAIHSCKAHAPAGPADAGCLGDAPLVSPRLRSRHIYV